MLTKLLFLTITKAYLPNHERMKSTRQAATDYDLSITSSLKKKKNRILNSKTNKQRLASVLSTFFPGVNITIETRNDSAFTPDEADKTMVSCVIQAANNGKYVILMVSEDRCVCFTGLLGTHSSITVQGPDGEMEWNSTRYQCNLY